MWGPVLLHMRCSAPQCAQARCQKVEFKHNTMQEIGIVVHRNLPSGTRASDAWPHVFSPPAAAVPER